MTGLGTIVNVIAIIAGAFIGILFKCLCIISQIFGFVKGYFKIS